MIDPIPETSHGLELIPMELHMDGMGFSGGALVCAIGNNSISGGALFNFLVCILCKIA